MFRLAVGTLLIAALAMPRGILARPADEGVDRARERKVQAAFLVNFVRFIQWPDSAFDAKDAKFIIGVQGDDALAQVVARSVGGVTVQGREIQAVRLSDDAETESQASCHVLFLGDLSRQEREQSLQKLSGKPILLVSDANRFARIGGMVGFVLNNGKIGFEINREVLEKAGLKASAKLLKLARLVESDE